MDLTRNITLGVYLPRKSAVHLLDPRTKIITAASTIIALLLINSYSAYFLFTGAVAILIAAAAIPPSFALRGLRPMLPVLVLMWVFQFFLFSKPGATPLFTWHFFSPTDAGLEMANMITLRVILLFTVTTILTLTTTMSALTDGLEKLLGPLKKIGLPSHELVMTMIIALRFVLILAEELDKIVKAQMARGVAFDRGNFIKRTAKLFPVLLPLFICAFRRAEEMIVAMESRSYTGGRGRTRMKMLSFSRQDWVAFAIVSAFIAAALTINYI